MIRIREDLTDSQWRKFKQIYQGIANVYFTDNDNDDWHNMFLEVRKEIKTLDWPDLYNRLKMLRGDHV